MAATDNHETDRRLGDVLRIGIVAEVDHAAARCVVAFGELLTGPLPWLTLRAGDVRVWSPPTVGEQAVVLCPEGEIEGGVVVTGLYCDAFPAPSANGDLVAVQFKDGAVIAYNQATHELHAELPAGGKAKITAPAGVEVIGDLKVTGNVTVTGKADVEGEIKSAADVLAGAIRLKTHKHTAVAAGSAQSGPPA